MIHVSKLLKQTLEAHITRNATSKRVKVGPRPLHNTQVIFWIQITFGTNRIALEWHPVTKVYSAGSESSVLTISVRPPKSWQINQQHELTE